MPITTPTNPLPARSMLQSAFDAAMAALMTYIPTFVSNANALETAAASSATTATTQANIAIAQAALAANSATAADNSATLAQNAALSAGSIAWVSGTTYSIGDLRYSPINLLNYRRKTAGAGTIDPSADPTNWQAIAPVSAAANLYQSANLGGF